jgi:hypothetical protein
LAFSRLPNAEELQACVSHWQRGVTDERTRVYEPVVYADEIQRTVMAEKTGEPYTFTEFMPAYKTYQPDLQPSQVDARTRALAHVLRVLMNTNEFCYLD